MLRLYIYAFQYIYCICRRRYIEESIAGSTIEGGIEGGIEVSIEVLALKKKINSRV